MNGYSEIERLWQRYNNFGLLRFTAFWLLALSLFGTIVPSTMALGVVGVVGAVIVIFAANAQRRAVQTMIGAIFELHLHTPEGQQAVRDATSRRLRDGGR